MLFVYPLLNAFWQSLIAFWSFLKPIYFYLIFLLKLSSHKANSIKSFGTSCPDISKFLTKLTANPIFSSVSKEKAVPWLSPLPVLPMRWMWVSRSFGTSTFITQVTSFMSNPREATSVAISSLPLDLKSFIIWVRSYCNLSPCKQRL